MLTFVFFIALRSRFSPKTWLPWKWMAAILILSPSSITNTTFFSVLEMSSIRYSTVALR